MKRSLISTAFAIAILTLGAGLSAAQKITPEDAIRTADQQWLKVFAARDLERSVAFCAEDGSILAPNQPVATGRDAIGKSFSGFFALPALNISCLIDMLPRRFAISARSKPRGPIPPPAWGIRR